MKLNYKSILIVTYGRSGSTLLQGIINEIDGCLIRGENNNFFYNLFKSYKDIIISKTQSLTNNPTHPWFGAQELNIDTLLENFNIITKNQLTSSCNEEIECYGFKEIRYLSTDINNDFNEYLDFLSKIFPAPLIIFNTRNLDDVVKSGWWKDIKYETAMDLLIDAENKFKYYSENNKNTFQISYNDILTKSENLKCLFDKIGAEYDSKKIDLVLTKDHSYKTKSSPKARNRFSLQELTGGSNSLGKFFLSKEETYRTNMKNNSYSHLAAKEMSRKALLYSPLSKKTLSTYIKHHMPFLITAPRKIKKNIK